MWYTQCVKTRLWYTQYKPTTKSFTEIISYIAVASTLTGVGDMDVLRAYAQFLSDTTAAGTEREYRAGGEGRTVVDKRDRETDKLPSATVFFLPPLDFKNDVTQVKSSALGTSLTNNCVPNEYIRIT